MMNHFLKISLPHFLILAALAYSVTGEAQSFFDLFKKPSKKTSSVHVKTSFTDTYMGRLFNQRPHEYDQCLALGPTPENIEGKYCARATRSIYDCAKKTSNTYCGGYAFTYAGRGCLEKRGMTNVISEEVKAQVPAARQRELCNSPGTIMVFEGRCKAPAGSLEPMAFEECKKTLIAIEGEEAYWARVEKMGSEAAATSGDRVGHMEMVAYRSADEVDKLSYNSYAVRPVPASHRDDNGKPAGVVAPDGEFHYYRKLVACYLPGDDAVQLVKFLQR